MKNIHKKDNRTDHAYVKSTERRKVCSLKNAIDLHIDGKLFCLAHIGQTKHKYALNMCQNVNATLPLPRSLKEYNHLTESFKRLGIDTKLKDFSTKIVLNARRLPNKGRVSLFYFLPSLNTWHWLSLIKDTFKSKVNESLTFVNWALGQPNNFGNDQNFVSISYPNLKWGDWSGDTIGEVICQQEIKGKSNLSCRQK